ncbi:hypothetical protein QBC40DRAFT_268715 [Triangularia verruculosa]|uniref:RNase MRP protein 1 RNA binding domain-containing protein n=1 Tax=Triangularia verruculosa TaxID=2587418 RepID=A0AAN6X8N4_9PEZI|nr:hypothetical protein QBC40DRAFT_268715 [Triangularia verruculosa]
MSQPPPAQPAAITPELLESSLQTLLPLSDILQRLHYRNKNQHSSSRWWAAFDILRRNTGKLVGEMEGCLVDTSDGGKKGKKGKKWGEGVEMVRRRAVFMREGVVRKGWEGFGGLVGDRRFSPLGLALVGVLGGVRGVVEGLVHEEGGDEMEGGEVEVDGGMGDGGEEEVDVGERVEREVVMASVEGERKGEQPKTKKKKRGGGGGGDEFDDIFGGLEKKKASKKRAVEKVLLDGPGSDGDDAPSPGPITSKLSRLEPDDVETSDAKSPPSKPSSKKKKKQVDEFDGIFGGFEEDKPKKKKKKVVGGDEFDDIFGGLGEEKPKKKKMGSGGVAGLEKKKKKKRKDEFDDIFAGF